MIIIIIGLYFIYTTMKRGGGVLYTTTMYEAMFPDLTLVYATKLYLPSTGKIGFHNTRENYFCSEVFNIIEFCTLIIVNTPMCIYKYYILRTNTV